ncbi:hypothetical protein BCV70DRAFT_201846 [Testicularia cyperi]|uniref:t-SNARE coiled-coil homology domain-containing protein n=1 Tax=Testicularia cyperi TaxID=1882483 RepID=A0A317XKE8_9BASI|nr:hypothetical protein BCV70DRAFT_201846 [Testicularia cyperi]
MSSPNSLDPTKNPFADEDEDGHNCIPATSSSAGGHASSGNNERDELSALQQQHWNEQDEQLDVLSRSLNRQHEMSVQMNEELDLHHELLEEFDGDVERTGLHLGGASRKLDTLRRSVKDHGSVWALGGLIVLLIVLIAMFK